MPQNSNFRLPRGHRFRPKLDFTVMAPITAGTPLGCILGPMGSHWIQKMGQNPKKWPWPQIRIYNYPAVIDFDQNSTLRLWRQITVGTPWGPSWGQWGPIGSKKLVKTVKYYHSPKFEFSTTLRSSISTKIDFTVLASNHRWDPLRSILRPMGPMGSKNWVKTVKNYHAPKFEFSTTLRSSISAKIHLYG